MSARGRRREPPQFDREAARAEGERWAERRWKAHPELRTEAPPFVLDGPSFSYGATPAYWNEATWRAREHWRELQAKENR